MTCNTIITKVMRLVVRWCGKSASPHPPYPLVVVVQRTATPPRPGLAAGAVVRGAAGICQARERERRPRQCASFNARPAVRRRLFPPKETTMSRGIGHLQRGILTRLAARPGGDMLTDTCGHRAWLAGGVHDLRAISREMARAAGVPDYEYATSVWTASFSRAIARLAQRHMIDVLWRVPLCAIEPEFAWPSAEFAGGIHLNWFSRQRRFVRMYIFT